MKYNVEWCLVSSLRLKKRVRISKINSPTIQNKMKKILNEITKNFICGSYVSTL